MNGIALVMLAALGQVDYQVETTADRQLQYTIQIEPEILRLVAGGELIYSDVPADAGPITRICLRIGKNRPVRTPAAEQAFQKLVVSASRWADARGVAAPGDAPPTILWPDRKNPEQTLGVTFGYQPDAEGQQAYFVQVDPAVFRTLVAGDELYAPIDPAAGRLGRFVVSSGNKALPRVASPAGVTPIGGLAQQPPARTNLDLLPVDGGRTQFQPDGGGGFSPAPVAPPLAPPVAQRGHDFNTLPPAESPATAGGSFNPRTGGGFNPAATNPAATTTNFNPPANEYGRPPGRLSPTGAASPPSITNPSGYAPPANYAPPQVADARGYAPPGSYPNQSPAQGFQSQNGYGTPYDNRVASQPPPLVNPNSAPLATLPQTAPGMVAPGLVAPGTVAPAKETWGIFVVVLFALFFSIGGNLYLAWTALEFHNRYRSAIDRLRSAARSS